MDTKKQVDLERTEHANAVPQSDVFDLEGEEVEPKLDARTWIALLAFVLLNYVQILALQGPAAVLNYIGTDLHNNRLQFWVISALSLTQGVLGPIIANASDVFQARKLLLVVCCTISFIGCCVAPGSTNIYRLIGANVLIGVGFATVALAYAVPSEIMPRRWRPLVQAGVNMAAVCANITGPFMIAALTKRNAHIGWRDYYWFQAGVWGLTTVALIIGYRPPKRQVQTLSFWTRLASLDIIGFSMLTPGLALWVVGFSLGGNTYPWRSVGPILTIILGFLLIVAFGLYEWKGTTTGVLHHDFFRGGREKTITFSSFVIIIALEGAAVIVYGLFFPLLIQILITPDPVLIVAHTQAAWICALFSAIVWTAISTRFRTIRGPLFAGLLCFTAGLVGMCTLEPNQSAHTIGLGCLFGIGLGAPLSLIVAGIQLSAPKKLIATATACATSSRSISAAVYSAIAGAVFDARIAEYLPSFIAKAALATGIPQSSIPAFIQAITTGNTTALNNVPGISQASIVQGTHGLQQAYADALRVVFIMAVPFAAAACVGCWFIGDVSETMNQHIDAPMAIKEVGEKDPEAHAS